MPPSRTTAVLTSPCQSLPSLFNVRFISGNDSGSGSYKDISVGRPTFDLSKNPGVFYVGQFVLPQEDFEATGRKISVLFMNGSQLVNGKPAFRSADGFVTKWCKTDPSNPSRQWSLLTPVVGDISEMQPEQADAEKAHYGLVHKDLVIPSGTIGKLIWDDKGSGMQDGGSVWALVGSDGAMPALPIDCRKAQPSLSVAADTYTPDASQLKRGQFSFLYHLNKFL